MIQFIISVPLWELSILVFFVQEKFPISHSMAAGFIDMRLSIFARNYKAKELGQFPIFLTQNPIVFT